MILTLLVGIFLISFLRGPEAPNQEALADLGDRVANPGPAPGEVMPVAKADPPADRPDDGPETSVHDRWVGEPVDPRPPSPIETSGRGSDGRAEDDAGSDRSGMGADPDESDPKPEPEPQPNPEPEPEPDLVSTSTRPRATDRERYPRTLEEIRSTLAAIASEPDDPGMPAEVSAALRRLRAYRFLAGLPYREVVLDPEFNDLCAAAAEVCRGLGYLSHAPENPGLPAELYERGRLAAGKSNLAFSTPPMELERTVDLWMSDSDDHNIDRLGHRRWCLNPSMGKTGFGRSGDYTAMWALDQRDPPVDDYDLVAHPPAGFVPSGFFRRGDAWSLSVNPSRYAIPRPDDVRVRIEAVDAEGEGPPEGLKLDYRAVETGWFGVPNCIIFRPRALDPTEGGRFRVVVTGVERAGGGPADLSYVVEFVP